MKGAQLGSSIELAAFRLILNSSFFSKLILSMLFIFSTISWAIMIQKFFFLASYRAELSRFLKSITSHGNPEHLEESCKNFTSGVAKTMPILIVRLLRSNSQGKLRMPPDPFISNVAMHETNKLREGMGILATAANVSPLIGLLGTVWGIMYSFMSIGQEGSANIAVVAPGIAEALLTTIGGLLVAIPAMAGHNFLTGRINTCLDMLDSIGEYALSVLNPRAQS